MRSGLLIDLIQKSLFKETTHELIKVKFFPLPEKHQKSSNHWKYSPKILFTIGAIILPQLKA
ncbi:hypothetical protein [Azospirillum doebereinerae]